MEIGRLDPNLKVEARLTEPHIVWYDAAGAPFVLYGCSAEPQGGAQGYRRMAAAAAVGVSEGVAENMHTAGIRLRFRTDSPFVAIRALWHWQCTMPHMPCTGSSGFDLYTADEGRFAYQGTMVPPTEAPHGFEAIVYTSGTMRDYVLNFPLYNDVAALQIGVRDGAAFETPACYRNAKPVIFYGSSITQGGCASRPGNCYPNFLSRALNMDYLNLGFSGNAKGEPAMARYMAALPMAAFVSDYDYLTNADSAESLRETHFALYRRIRAAHPTVPYLMVTKPNWRHGREDDSGRAIIFESFRRAVAEGDDRVWLVDGAGMFADTEADACTVDGCHPNDLGFYRMYRALLPVLAGCLELSQ